MWLSYLLILSIVSEILGHRLREIFITKQLSSNQKEKNNDEEARREQQNRRRRGSRGLCNIRSLKRRGRLELMIRARTPEPLNSRPQRKTLLHVPMDDNKGWLAFSFSSPSRVQNLSNVLCSTEPLCSWCAHTHKKSHPNAICVPRFPSLIVHTYIDLLKKRVSLFMCSIGSTVNFHQGLINTPWGWAANPRSEGIYNNHAPLEA
jgi:hypothetical protein